MTTHKRHRLVRLFLATAVAIAPLLVAQPADAGSTALFRLMRTWWGWTTTAGTADPWISSQYHPRSKGPNMAPWPSVFVGSTTIAGDLVPRFTVPGKFIRDYTWTDMCVGGGCSPGYPQFSQQYSYWNQPGSFRPNNSRFGGASMTTTVIFPTVGGNPLPPINAGAPVTPTTTPCVGGGLTTTTGPGTKFHCGYLPHDFPPGGTAGGAPPPREKGDPIRFYPGDFDFDRAGSIMITPGKNRFGGTMLFFYGPNHLYYQRTTINGYETHGYGPQFDNRTPNANTAVGDVQYGGFWNKYRMTTEFETQRSVTPARWSIERVHTHGLRQPNPPRRQGCYLNGSPANCSRLRSTARHGRIDLIDLGVCQRLANGLPLRRPSGARGHADARLWSHSRGGSAPPAEKLNRA